MMAAMPTRLVRPVTRERTTAAGSAPSAILGLLPQLAKASPNAGASTRNAFRRRSAPRQGTIVAASNDVQLQGVDEGDGAPGSDYTSLFALAAFAAQYFEQWTVNVPFLLKAFAVFSLVNAAAAIVFNESAYDKIGTVIAPAVLAANVVLTQVDTLSLVVAVIGWYLSYELKGLPFWGWIATLVAAIYYGYGTHWVVAAYAFGTLTRVLDGLENNKVPVISVPVLAVSAFAFAKEYKSLWVLSLALGEVARSFYNLARRVKDSEPKGLTKHNA